MSDQRFDETRQMYGKVMKYGIRSEPFLEFIHLELDPDHVFHSVSRKRWERRGERNMRKEQRETHRVYL